MKDQPPTNLSVVLDFAKSLVWPALLLFLFLAYRHEITQIVESLPPKFRKASKFSAGSISFEIEKAAAAVGNEELANLLDGLSPQALNALIHLGDVSYSVVSKHDKQQIYRLVDEYPAFLELEKNGLITSKEQLVGFERFFNNLPNTRETVYKSIKHRETYSSSKSEDTPIASQIISVSMNAISDKDDKRIRDLTVRLSEKGMIAYTIILKVVSELIGTKSP